MTEGDSTKVLDASSASTLFTGKVCLCTTNRGLSHKKRLASVRGNAELQSRQ